MITRRFIPKGWYAAARPGGKYAALVTGQHVQTPHGLVPLPKGQNLLFVDLAPDGVELAGTGGADDRAWFWTGTEWIDRGGAYGAHAVLFQPDGALYINHNHALPTGVRQFSDAGTLVTCEQSNVDTGKRLWEFTTRGGITIGQGGEGPDGGDPMVAVLPDGTARLLQKGTCRAIRFYREGDELAIAWWQEDQRGAGLLWATVQDIEALPVYQRPVPIPAIGRPMWHGFFNFSPAFTPGNCTLNVSDLKVRSELGRAVAQYVAGKPEGDLQALNVAVAAAKGLGLPVVAYWPRSLQTGPLPAGDPIVGVEAYRLVSESLSAFEARVRAAVARCPRAALIAQCYTSNVSLTADLASLVPVYARIAKDCKNVEAVLVFSGNGRATGLNDHPEMVAPWKQFASGIPRAPAVEEFMEPWKVKVEHYDPTIERGKRHVTRVAVGNGVVFEFQKEADEKMHVELWKDGKWQDRSGGRHVEVRG